MLISIRFGETDSIDVECKLQAADHSQPGIGPEIVSAVIARQELPNLQVDECMDLIGQIHDHLTTVQQAPVRQDKDDWRHLFRSGNDLSGYNGK